MMETTDGKPISLKATRRFIALFFSFAAFLRRRENISALSHHLLLQFHEDR